MWSCSSALLRRHLSSAVFTVYTQALPFSGKDQLILKWCIRPSSPLSSAALDMEFRKGNPRNHVVKDLDLQIPNMSGLNRQWRRSWQAGAVEAEGTAGTLPLLLTRGKAILRRRWKDLAVCTYVCGETVVWGWMKLVQRPCLKWAR